MSQSFWVHPLPEELEEPEDVPDPEKEPEDEELVSVEAGREAVVSPQTVSLLSWLQLYASPPPL